ncbi:Type IV secretion/conjugal transfer ATPase, VirB4 family [Burkholderiales bacterium]|nr:Type IV secretion/conjugal transfer ATPase, VirB4 family [Burkholderiales bacterium]
MRGDARGVGARADGRRQDGRPRFWSAAQTETPLAAFIPWSSLIDERTVLTRGGDYVRVWRLEGLAFETAGVKYIADCHESACNVIRTLGGGNFALWSHVAHRRVVESLPAPSDPPFAAELDREYQARLSVKPMMAMELYLTLLYRPFTGKAVRAFSSRRKSIEQVRRAQETALAELDEKGAILAGGLREFGPSQLASYDHDGVRHSELAEFLRFLVTGHWRRLPQLAGPLYRHLAGARVFFGGANVEVWDGQQRRYGTLVDILEYPPNAQPGTLDCLLYQDVEFLQTQSFAMLGKRDALAALQRQQKQLFSSEDLAVSQVEQMTQALDEVADGALTVGEYHYSLLVWGEDIRDAARRAASLTGALSEQAAVQLAPVDLVPDGAYFAQWPGNFQWRAREAKLTSRAFSALSCNHSFAQGKREGNPWGPALTLLRTPSGVPFFLNLHASPDGEDSADKKLPGNTFLLGSTGSGKTTLELFLLAQMRRFSPAPRMVLFDVDRGSEIFIRALRGRYLTLPIGKPTGLNPFQQPSTERWLRLWEELVKFCVRNEAMPLMPKDEAAISAAVRATSALDARYRRLSAVRQSLPKDSENSLYHRLGRWCRGGPMGWVFDEAPDTLAGIGQLPAVAFDYTEFVNEPQIRTPIMMYLLEVVESLIDGSRFVYSIAECWKALDDPVFVPFIKYKQKTIRKQNGIGIFDTQSPDDALRSPIARAMVEQCVTKICLPNADAVASDYVEGFGLTMDEYEIVKGLGHGAVRRFLVKQNSRSAIAQLDLSGMDDALLALSGTTDNVLLLDEIRASVGDDPDAWLPLLRQAARARREALKGRRA